MEQPRTWPELIERARKLRRVRHMTELERKARDGGYTITHTTLGKLWRGNYPSVPSRKTMEALAFLAEVPYELVATLAGVPTSGAPFATKLPQKIDVLDSDSQEVVVDVLRRMVKMQLELDELRAEVERLRSRSDDPPETGSIYLTEQDVTEGTDENYSSVEVDEQGNPRDHSG